MKLDRTQRGILQSTGRSLLETNSVRTADERIASAESGRSRVIGTDWGLFLLTGHAEYDELEYFCVDADHTAPGDVIEDIRSLNRPVYAKVVYHDRTMTSDNPLESLGFCRFREYFRCSLSSVPDEGFREYASVENADIADVDEFLNILADAEDFDPMADDLPDKDEITDSIQNGAVYKVSDGDRIAGFLIHEDKGVRSFSRMLCVSPMYRNGVVGYSLLAHFINECRDRIKLFYGWINRDNSGSVRLHQMFGYKPDGLNEIVYKL